MFSFILDTKETSTKERRGSPKGTDFEMANGRFAQQISAIVTPVFVAEERASEKDDVGKVQELYVLL